MAITVGCVYSNRRLIRVARCYNVELLPQAESIWNVAPLL